MTIPRGNYTKHFLTVHPTSADPDSMFTAVADFVREHQTQVVAQFVFGGSELSGSGIPEAERLDGHGEWPVTWIHGDGPSGAAFSGTQLTAVAGEVTPIRHQGETIGSLYEDAHARYCRLGNLHAADPSATREEQAQAAFDLMVEGLAQAGMSLDHVVRTWLYLDRILEWYDAFNGVRTRFFEAHRLFDGLVPASTGIGAANARGAAMVADVFAVQPKSGDVRIAMVDSPLQGAAWEYGSSFSRAVRIDVPDCSRLIISGTASITPDGATAHVGDPREQIALTMEVVEAILDAQEMTWADTSRSIAYFKDIGDAPLFSEYCRRRGLPHFPVSLAHADICRDDLLFEIELDAITLK